MIDEGFIFLLMLKGMHYSSFSSCAQADLCVPRLNEGDQVVLINGRDISEHTHDQVVMFIKASCESHSGELILLVRPNGERCAQTSTLPQCFGELISYLFITVTL